MVSFHKLVSAATKCALRKATGHLRISRHIWTLDADTVDSGICSLGSIKCQGVVDTDRAGLVWLCHHRARPDTTEWQRSTGSLRISNSLSL